MNKIPVLIIPAWINKFYILNLQHVNSYVKWLVEQGYTVWSRMSILINCIGYCLGYTLLSATLAYLVVKKLGIVKSATFLATLVDFTECGDVGVFIDEPELKYIEDLMARDWFLDGYYLRQIFSMLRADEMIWSFFINNYLLGRTPQPFDILYWNSDSTRLPASMHSYYLRNLYQKNALVKPDGIVLNGIEIDLRKIEIPTYILATKDDRIAPWESSTLRLWLYTVEKNVLCSVVQGMWQALRITLVRINMVIGRAKRLNLILLNGWNLRTLLKAHGGAIGSSGSGNFAALKFQQGKLTKMSLSRMLQAVM